MHSRRGRSGLPKWVAVGCQQRPARKSPSRRRLAGPRPVKQEQRVLNGWRNSARRLERCLLSQRHEISRSPPLLFEPLRYRGSGLDLLPLSHHQAVNNWALKTPPRFVFSLKIPRTITHEKVLVDCDKNFEEFVSTGRVGREVGADGFSISVLQQRHFQ